MNLPFDPLVGLLIFLGSAAVDGIYAKFLDLVNRGRAVAASSICAGWHLVGALMVTEYSQNPIYCVFLAAGGFVGTLTVLTLQNRTRGPAATGRPTASVEARAAA